MRSGMMRVLFNPSGGERMIDRVGTVCIFVQDQDRAKKFYTEVLGFELRTDAILSPGSTNRWIAVAPKGAETEVILYLPDENWEHYRQVVGHSQALTFEVSDMEHLHATLRARGVRFVQEPDVQPWGTYAILQDSEGNSLILREAPKA
jgi:catechol 2,3-dioxygenase-like lactoylglutathione lyase family enzyme